MTKPISVRDEQVLAFIVQFLDDKGYPPTVREIGEQLGMSSPSTVQAHMVSLADAGYIERSIPGSPRAVKVLRRDAGSDPD